MAAVWDAQPSLTPAQVQARFGAGARLVRRGDGKWTIAGGSGLTGTVTPTPAPIRNGFTPPPGNAMAAPPPAAAATPPVPPAAPLPVSFGQQSNITNLEAQRSGLSGIYNPQRNTAAINAARGLTDEGYYDVATPMAVSTDPVTGAVTYSVAGQGEGRVYRENRGNINAGANSRGMLYSSATTAQQRQSATALENARQAALRSVTDNQNASIAQQTSDYTNLSGQIGNAQGDYADWRAGQAVPLPAPSSETAIPAAPKPPTAAGSSLPRVINRPGAGSIPALKRMGYVQRGAQWIRR